MDLLYTSLSQAILDNIPDQAWLKDRASRYVAVNEAFARDCGHDKHEIIGRGPKDVWPADWGDIYLRTDREVLDRQVRRRYEETRLSRDGQLRWFDTIKTPIRDPHGAVVGTAGISRDITDRKLAERELQRVNRCYALRSAISHAIAHARQERTLFARVCRSWVEWDDWDLACICRLAPGGARQGATLLPQALRASSPALQRRCRQALQPGAPLLAHLPLARRGIRTQTLDAANAHPFHAWALAQGFRQWATVPIAQPGQPGVVMLLCRRAAEPAPSALPGLLRSFARDLAHALAGLRESERRMTAEDELRRLSASLQTVREQERKRISRELHDELGQALTALQIGLGVLLDPRRRATDALQRRLESLHDLAADTVHTVQRISAELRPPMLDNLGLVPAIDWLIETLADRSATRFDFEAAELPPLDEACSTALFRIAQEALTNVCRHAQAGQARVRLRADEAQVELSVADDGRGFDLPRQYAGQMLGLIGMRERAQDLGGRLRIVSQPGLGTRVEAVLPRQPRPAP